MSGWLPWAFIATFLLVYAAAWHLGGWWGKRQNRKHGRLR